MSNGGAAWSKHEAAAKAEAAKQPTEEIVSLPIQDETGLTVPAGSYRINDQQKKAAQLLAANDMAMKKERMSFQDISANIGIHHDTLKTWRSNPEFQRYKNDIVTLSLHDAQAMATSRLIEMADGSITGTPSMKAIELIMKLSGRLSDKQEITVKNDTSNGMKTVSDEELDDIVQQYAEMHDQDEVIDVKPEQPDEEASESPE
ncbi:phBC6A51 family helix-turn-helix protein [Salibacterium sp. K-3]